MDSHRNSMSKLDLVAVWSKSTLNSMTIPCHLSRFYLFSMLEHDMNFGQVQVMEFPWHVQRKWWDFHRICDHFWPNCRQKDMRKNVSHFLQGGFRMRNTHSSFIECLSKCIRWIYPWGSWSQIEERHRTTFSIQIQIQNGSQFNRWWSVQLSFLHTQLRTWNPRLPPSQFYINYKMLSFKF